MVAEFYKDCEIFFTGGSGVVGKSAIEKLLRSCDVKRIYILLRCKKGVRAEDRLHEIKKSKIFKVLIEEKPNELDKLVVIPGDTSLDGLGISPEHKGNLRNVSVFFHSAATTRFDEPLKTAIRLNVKSTLEALKLAETFKNLKMFIHVSTFFSNPYLKFIENKVYPAVFNWKTALKMLENDTNDADIEAITKKVTIGFPNTYLFTKHLAEQVVNDYRFRVPVGIYRPSIVIGALQEPEPGFTETSSGIMGLILVWSLGIMQVLVCRTDIQLDLTPLDSGTKVLLMSTARIAQLPREKIQESTPVTIFSSRGLLKYRLDEQIEFLNKGIAKYPLSKAIWLPDIVKTTSSMVYMFLTVFLQLIPSMLIDGLLRICGQEPFLMKIQRKIFVTVKVLSFFLNNEYNSYGITDSDEYTDIGRGTDFNIDCLFTSSDTDEHMAESMEILAYGCRKFMNEDDSTLPKSRKIMRWKKMAYNVLKGYIVYLIGKRVLRLAMTYADKVF